MGVQSGIIPYHYDGPIPFRIPPDGPDIGMSGVLFEQPHFVIAAELRRFRSLPAYQLPMRKFVNLAVATTQEEARGVSPFFLDSPVEEPGAVNFVNYILNTRVQLDNLMNLIAGDTVYSSTEVKLDWLRNACPSPSSVNGNYLRRLHTTPGEILDLAPLESILGGSGVLYDNDICEIMYQPYSRMSNTRYLDVTAEGSEFFLRAGPLWPSFQKTDGSLISLNSRDAALTFSVPGRSLPFIPGDGTGYDSVGSGYIQLDGDVLLSNTDYMVFENPGDTPFNHFTFVIHGARLVGRKDDGSDGYSRVFVTPQPLAEGIYSVVPRTTRDANPYVILPSGDISQWPRPGGAGSTQETTIAGTRLGYSSFDATLWVTDWSTNSVVGFPERIPSGLAVICPFTGDPLFVRHADTRLFTLGGTANGQRWGDLIGMERIGPNSIIRLTQDYRDPPPVGTFQFSFVEYNDALDYVGQTDVLNSTVENISDNNFRDMFWDPDNFRFVVLDDRATGSEVFTFDATFTFVEDYEGVFKTPIRAARLNGNYWALQDAISGPSPDPALPGNHLQKFELVPPAGGEGSVGAGSIVWGETKVIQLEVIPGLSGSVSFVHDAQVVSGGDGGPFSDGIWLLMQQGPGMVFIRVIEEADSWTPQEAIRTPLDPFIGGTNRYDFLAMPL